MRKHTVVVAVVAVLAVIGALLFFVPYGQDDDTSYSNAPDIASRASVENARLVLPLDAGEPARVYFDVTNRAADFTLFVTDVAVEDSLGSMIASPQGPVTTKQAKVPVSPGETVRFGAEDMPVVLTNYNSDVVPGAQVRMRLTFGDADTLTVPMTVEYADGNR